MFANVLQQEKNMQSYSGSISQQIRNQKGPDIEEKSYQAVRLNTKERESLVHVYAFLRIY